MFPFNPRPNNLFPSEGPHSCKHDAFLYHHHSQQRPVPSVVQQIPCTDKRSCETASSLKTVKGSTPDFLPHNVALCKPCLDSKSNSDQGKARGRNHGGRRSSSDEFSQSNRYSTIGTRQNEYHEALLWSANDEVRCDCTFADDGNAS